MIAREPHLTSYQPSVFPLDELQSSAVQNLKFWPRYLGNPDQELI
jgi:hypothetical protein